MATASPSTAFTEYTLANELGKPAPQAEAHGNDFAMPLALFLITMVTTCMMGARFAANFAMGLPPIAQPDDMLPIGWVFSQPSRLVEGIPFSFTILTILLAHELGHYYACRRHKVDATLPYFLPAPTLSGTMGAVIKLRTRVPTRAALLDIGISGPFWGFLVSLPLILLGLLLSTGSAHGNSFIASAPPIFYLMNGVVHSMRPGWPALDHILFHPVLLACWIGMFVTFLNLLPAGQLDGGHVLYSVFPKLHRGVTNAVILLLILAGALLWLGWIFWAVLLMLPMMRHPKVPLEPALDGNMRWLPWLALAILLLTVMPAPFAHSSLQYFLR
jgi:Zn-dependent protease